MTSASPSILNRILIPSLITLAVTVLRLIGELQGWSEVLFRKSAGGFGAIVGIAWLALIFAIYFAVQLQNEGRIFERSGRAIGLTILSLLIVHGGALIWSRDLAHPNLPLEAVGILVTIAGLYVMRIAWPAYWNVMIAYALAARVPVILVMYLAIKGDWGTHYDAPAPGLTFTEWQTEFIQTGLIPQLFLWVPFTVVICGLFGVITAAVRKRRTAVARA